MLDGPEDGASALNDAGPGAFIGVTAIIVITLIMVIRYVLGMITHLPDNLPRWIGGQGNNVGDRQAAESANQGGANSVKAGARNGFAVGNTMAGEGAEA